MVLTSSMNRTHGRGRVSEDGSNGSLVLNEVSSSAASFQTMSLLSLPCLTQDLLSAFYSVLDLEIGQAPVSTYVITWSSPQPAIPNMALS